MSWHEGPWSIFGVEMIKISWMLFPRQHYDELLDCGYLSCSLPYLCFYWSLQGFPDFQYVESRQYFYNSGTGQFTFIRWSLHSSSIDSQGSSRLISMSQQPGLFVSSLVMSSAGYKAKKTSDGNIRLVHLLHHSCHDGSHDSLFVKSCDTCVSRFMVS